MHLIINLFWMIICTPSFLNLSFSSLISLNCLCIEQKLYEEWFDIFFFFSLYLSLFFFLSFNEHTKWIKNGVLSPVFNPLILLASLLPLHIIFDNVLILLNRSVKMESGNVKNSGCSYRTFLNEKFLLL